MSTILSVAYPFAAVGPDSAGGAEQVLSTLDSAWISKGWNSIMIACEGSTTEGILIPVPGVKGRITEECREEIYGECRSALNWVLENWPVDLVHMHGVDFDSYLPQTSVPVLVTLHLPLEFYSPSIFHTGANIFFNCVSHDQLRRVSPPSTVPVVENGIQVHEFGLDISKRRFALCLGRICREKGFHLALEAARMAGITLILAGEVFPYAEHEAYFADEILPRLARSRSKFLGPVGFERKRRLLNAAQCVLIPSLVPETSSLVAIEALASGTPAIAFRAGALSEIIEHGRTGFLVSDETEMAEAIGKANMISPDDCRAAAAQRFQSKRMVGDYLDLYKKILSGAGKDRSVPFLETAT